MLIHMGNTQQKQLQARRFQRGVTTLLVSLIVLFVSTLVFFGLNRSTLLELKTANNFYFQSKAQEAARGGVEYGLAWLNTAGNSVSAWGSNSATLCAPPVTAGCRPSGNDENGTVSLGNPVSIGGHSVDITFWRLAANPYVIEVLAIAVETANQDARAAARSKYYVRNSVEFNLGTSPPMIMNGCLSGVVGTPNIDLLPSGSSGVALSTSQAAGCTDTGNFSLDGGAVNTGVGMPGSSAWSYLFGSSKAEIKALALGASNNIYYFDASCPYPCSSKYSNLNGVNWRTDVGSSTSYGMVIFDTGSGCPKISGNVQIYGIVYYASDCSDQGWGTADIYGLLITDGAITKLNSTATLHESLYTTNSSYYNNGSKTVAKVIGSWRDF